MDKSTGQSNSARRKILIIDDHPQICELIRLTLAPLHARLFEAGTAEQGLAMAQAQQPDAIILDVQLAGGIDGFEVCRRIKSSPELEHTRVIIVTTQSQGSALRASEAARADAFLTKPFSPKALLDTVARFFPTPAAGERQRCIS
jgi:two-component system phosphate regulon response regulator PhoB